MEGNHRASRCPNWLSEIRPSKTKIHRSKWRLMCLHHPLQKWSRSDSEWYSDSQRWWNWSEQGTIRDRSGSGTKKPTLKTSKTQSDRTEWRSGYVEGAVKIWTWSNGERLRMRLKTEAASQNPGRRKRNSSLPLSPSRLSSLLIFFYFFFLTLAAHP